ncbi:flavin reductase family protein [Rhizobium sp. KVB221]|uniref:Flavin reductase family protein n=2 Tax=Rhizobium setariae TaxID=2801340 RepID=A0A936YRB9_9HYPH|nr:flavin reductase family protein [Rhizobium setariae]
MASSDEFRAAMRHFVGNVSIITVGTGEDRSGLVATSAISLSVEPPTVIVCVNRSASAWQLFQRYGHFGVNSLSPQQQTIAERFSGAGGIKGADRYALGNWITDITGAALLKDAPVALDCELEEMIDRATHSILIGRVRAVHTSHNDGALTYWRGAYHPLGH